MRISGERGGALIAVLWLTAALSAIAFSVASSVRSEIDRATTASEGARSYYLARGAMERFLLDLDRSGPMLLRTTPFVRYVFPEGDAIVEMIPETSKLNINQIQEEELLRMLLAMGLEADRASYVTAAILDWRTPLATQDTVSPFDVRYLAQVPSFRARHASFEEIEELLLVDGVTRELFYGGFERNRDGSLAPRPGLRDCLSVFGTRGAVDFRTVPVPVMAAVEVPLPVIDLVVQARRQNPLMDYESLARLQPLLGDSAGRFVLGGRTMFTIRATARLRQGDRLSDTRRSVSALMKFNNRPLPNHILRWDDQAVTSFSGMDVAW